MPWLELVYAARLSLQSCLGERLRVRGGCVVLGHSLALCPAVSFPLRDRSL